ncbi:MAG TPA: hypothetical protein PKC76_11145 [Saprospiraceae bacterium]|nr:hypothetical protein [Saprospiraceae bacterium]HMP24682.1 hypothetical protein [Saprospiraceae bacterium]
MKNRFISASILSILALTFWHCNSPTAEYERMVRKALASGERQDSLFLGVYLGMTSKDFYAHCWELNRQGLVKEGPANASVQYYLPDTEPPIRMLFYPVFQDDKIHEMSLEFTYIGWAPWNRQFYADKLQVELLGILESWYGQGFIRLESASSKELYVKIDGNRRISLWQQDEQVVKGLITDLSVKKKVQPENDKRSLSNR